MDNRGSKGEAGVATDYLTIIQSAIVAQLKPLEASYQCRVSPLDLDQLMAPTVNRMVFVSHKGSTFSPPQYTDNYTQLETQTWEIYSKYIDLRTSNSINPLHTQVLNRLANFSPITNDQGLLKPFSLTNYRLVKLDPKDKVWEFSLDIQCMVLFQKGGL
jgi:hypothetical protein